MALEGGAKENAGIDRQADPADEGGTAGRGRARGQAVAIDRHAEAEGGLPPEGQGGELGVTRTRGPKEEGAKGGGAVVEPLGLGGIARARHPE